MLFNIVLIMIKRLKIKGYRTFDVNDNIQSILTNHLIFTRNIKPNKVAVILNAKYATIRQRKIRFLARCRKKRVKPHSEIQRQVNIIKDFFTNF
ncbi:MAG: hypothetical protein HeimC2_05020 [Candidatus Heimdallarchaeota archaeon LC_2]|nr:MAG: hypothetical protein HeimC2_05020 [Candidatus Heimdallarchaeota archaeon LC_2]